jgi:NTP pyrophosphatase (non-canonical NTP hydrolase)
MKLVNEFEPIRDWAKAKGIFAKGDVKTQYVKLQEEAGELAKAIIKDDKEEFIDALGDCVVVLVNLAKLGGYNLEDCINSAYDVIAKRTGSMINGSFVKNI